MKKQFSILKIKGPDELDLYKLFLTDQNEWRFNSGILLYDTKDGKADFIGFSGSHYSVDLDNEAVKHDFWQDKIDIALASDDIEIIPFEQFKEEFDVSNSFEILRRYP